MYEEGTIGGKILGIIFIIGIIGIGIIWIRGCVTHDYIKVVKSAEVTKINEYLGTKYTYEKAFDKVYSNGKWEQQKNNESEFAHPFVVYTGKYNDGEKEHDVSYVFYITDSVSNFEVNLSKFILDGKSHMTTTGYEYLVYLLSGEKPDFSKTVEGQYLGSAGNDSSSTEEEPSSDSSTSTDNALSPLNPNEPEYFNGTYVINYHRWFGGTLKKSNTSGVSSSGKPYISYIYQYDDRSTLDKYGELLQNDGFKLRADKNKVENGRNCNYRAYTKHDPEVDANQNRSLQVHLFIYKDDKNVTIMIDHAG
ncbi:MAG: hypothetical protein IJG16_11300 [Clostridia bacterium]|nr:hypothetical protein [Clostridia bacterium]